MDEATFRAMLLRQFDQANTVPDTSHDMYHDDAVLEFPQSGERFEGVENFREWRSIYPAEVTYEIHEIRGRDDLWIVELSVSYDGGPPSFGVSIHELRGDKIARETIYVAEGWDAPEWRKQWRAAPQLDSIT